MTRLGGARDAVTAVLGGGQGSRLWPLTKTRAKPAVPVGGRFRLIDVPISNSLHAGIDRIYVITQFNSESLHRHIAQTYRFDMFSGGYVHILAAEQTVTNRDWYQGTADAVRKNLDRLNEQRPADILILSGDQLYLMNVQAFLEHHRRSRADLTVAVKPVPREDASAFGIMRVDTEGRIVEFVEKPKEPELLDRFALEPGQLASLGFEAPAGSLLASMGIYAFRREVLNRALVDDGEATDFGHQVIPRMIGKSEVFAYNHTGYWQDIGTIPSFHSANLDLTVPLPPLDLYSPDRPIYTHPRFLPGTKIHACEVHESILCEGSIISGSSIRRSIVGIRAQVQEGSVIDHSIVMGATHFEAPGSQPGPRMGVGRNCVLRRAIVDFNARIGDGARLVNAAGIDHAEEEQYSIRDGIIVVHRDGVIAPGMEI
ncbi:MAG TPA: glucose-1-phosphate adenylyltransferase [Thermoanaerobaculia bacterium]|nr:glucose-1-phosphate adenylyltransferase [Thermoanaerobaculia bacterium]